MGNLTRVKIQGHNIKQDCWVRSRCCDLVVNLNFFYIVQALYIFVLWIYLLCIIGFNIVLNLRIW